MFFLVFEKGIDGLAERAGIQGTYYCTSHEQKSKYTPYLSPARTAIVNRRPHPLLILPFNVAAPLTTRNDLMIEPECVITGIMRMELYHADVPVLQTHLR